MVLHNCSHGLVDWALLYVRPSFVGRHAEPLEDHFQIHAFLAQLVKLSDVELEDEVAVPSQQVLEDAAEAPDVDTIRVWLL